MVEFARSGLFWSERLPGSFQGLVDFEDGDEAGDLQELMDSLGEVKQFQIAPHAARGCVDGH